MFKSSVATRRDLLRLSALGGVVVASNLLRGIAGCDGSNGSSAEGGAPTPRPGAARGAQEDFFFLQLSDTHWGFSGPKVNPDPMLELPTAIAAINAIATKPDFVMFTGDLTHNTDDAKLRMLRMTEFKQLVSKLDVPKVYQLPGEHDAGDDGGAAFRTVFGDTYYSFDHKGVHFIALDNVSDPRSQLGDTQLGWLQADLSSLDAEAPIVVFTHKPLWALRPDWDWTTLDGQKAIDLLLPFQDVTVFFGHIHQELEYMTGHIAHRAARSLMFVLPNPDLDADVPNPLPWNASDPNGGLGYRSVTAATEPGVYHVTEIPLPVPVVDAGPNIDSAAHADAGGETEAGER
jgi:3',5'-cyclic AMP phosphodiesterase CpdA